MTRTAQQPTLLVRINLFLTGALLLIALSTHALAQGPLTHPAGAVQGDAHRLAERAPSAAGTGPEDGR